MLEHVLDLSDEIISNPDSKRIRMPLWFQEEEKKGKENKKAKCSIAGLVTGVSQRHNALEMSHCRSVGQREITMTTTKIMMTRRRKITT